MPFPGYVAVDPASPTGQNNNYGSSPALSLVDADPRIISNLIVDQTLDNPAATEGSIKLR